MHFLPNPGEDAAPEELCRWNSCIVHHHQDFHKEAAERHVAGLAVHVCRGAQTHTVSGCPNGDVDVPNLGHNAGTFYSSGR